MRKVLIFGGAGLVLLFIIVLVVSLVSGSKKTTTNNTLTIWSPFDEGDVFNKISADYLTANPTVKLSFRYVPATDAKDYESKVVDALANGNGPDIWLLRTDWLGKHQAKLLPSTNYVSWSTTKKGLAAAEEYFGTAVADQNARGGELYSYPVSVDSLALYINTDVVNRVSNVASAANQAILNTAPATWNDVVAWSHLLTQKDSQGNITSAGLALGTTGNTYAAVDVYNALLYQYGGSLFSTDEKSVAIHLLNSQNQSPGSQALTLFSSFAKPSDPNYSWNAALGDPTTAFVNGKLAMMIGYSTLAKDMYKLNKNFSAVRVVPLPQVTDPAVSGKRVDAANYWSFGVSKFSSHPTLAWQYLKWLGNGALTQYAAQTNKPSTGVVKDGSIKLSSAGLGETALFAQQVGFAPAVFKPDWQTTDAVIQDMLNQALLPNQSVQSAVDSAAARLKALLPG